MRPAKTPDHPSASSFWRSDRLRARLRLAVALAVALATVSACGLEVARLLAVGESRDLRERSPDAPPNAPSRPGLLVLALDGIDRHLLYAMLREGELPELAQLLGGDGGHFPHAYLDETFLSTLPSSTMVDWVTALTGVPPAVHGVTGNEFFIRDRREFAAPVPVTFDDPDPVIACYTRDYVDGLSLAPSVYDRLRERDPDILVWVAMQHFHRGADRLLLTSRAVIVDAFEAFAEDQITEKLTQEESREVYARLDEEVIDVVEENLADGPVPDVLTIYLAGTDSYAHVSRYGPDRARRLYLREEIEPLVKRLAKALREHHALANRYVVVTGDHGHTQVMHDDAHALSMKGPDDPPALLRKAGFRVRPFKLEVPEGADFDAVLAYQGAMAFVYVADRSTCPAPGRPCDWSRPPRFEEDVLAVADAFHRNDRDGHLVPGMRGALDLVLARKPQRVEEVDLPFEVYVGNGELQPIGPYLKRHPHPTYLRLEERLRDLAQGPHGERAGDVILIAHNGDRDTPEERYYFAGRYRSWHGSPSRRDSEIPLIVANSAMRSEDIGSIVKQVLGDRPFQQRLTNLMIALREGAFEPVAGLRTPRRST